MRRFRSERSRLSPTRYSSDDRPTTRCLGKDTAQCHSKGAVQCPGEGTVQCPGKGAAQCPSKGTAQPTREGRPQNRDAAAGAVSWAYRLFGVDATGCCGSAGPEGEGAVCGGLARGQGRPQRRRSAGL